MAELARTLDMDLEVEAQERAVGPFRADILCKDISTNRWVLIENQLERTDHTHLRHFRKSHRTPAGHSSATV